MNDFQDKTTDELRKMAARLRHPGGKARRLEILAEIEGREGAPSQEQIDLVLDVAGGTVVELNDPAPLVPPDLIVPGSTGP